MENPPSRIKLNNDVWFDIKPDKLVFGGSFLPSGQHLTFPFGNKSGKFDLHLTKGRIQYPIIIIEHSNFLLIQSFFQENLIHSILKNLRPLENENLSGKIVVHASRGFNKRLDFDFQSAINSGIEGFKSNPESKRLKINQDTPKFNEFVNELLSNQEIKEMELSEFSKLENSFGVVVIAEKLLFLIKNKLTGNEVYFFDTLNLNPSEVIIETLGQDLSTYIFNEIEKGKEILEMENASEMIAEMELPILSIKTSS